ncbi:uncharacterized protein LOC143034470 isoform X1 [Oratosquilla oratoria]|uniref:uncharacterized protein LOC143034470 isoform X1 n=1 Tax=Oratosquilla oratoria TaxID=337810 RepID=UPI003F75A0A1
MPGTCCVPMCHNRGGHLFPRDKELKDLWTVAVRRGNWRPTTTSIVCKDHFTEEDFSTGLDHPMKARLKRGAVPSQFQWSTELSTEMSIKEEEADEPVEIATRRKIADFEGTVQPNCIQKSKKKEVGVNSLPRDYSESYECQHCSEVFEDESQLKDHTVIHENERPYVCSFCKASFRRKFNLKRHETIHKNSLVKTFKCQHCDKSFGQFAQLKEHRRTHSVEEPHKCTKCDAVFKKAADLRVHVFSHIQEQQNCSHCGTLCKGLCQLKKHFMTHTRKLPFKCSHCKASYAKQNELKLHMRIHTKEKIYDCAQCNVAFRRERDLNKHMNKHTVKKFYKCTHCEAFFIKAVHLKNHSKIHKQPHKCSECNATFIQERRLKDHLMIHTGERPYKCQFCDAAYIRADPLKWHVLRNHSGEQAIEDLKESPGSSSSMDKCSDRGQKSKSKQMHAERESKPRGRIAMGISNGCGSNWSEEGSVADFPLVHVDMEHFVKEELNGNDLVIKEHDVEEGFMDDMDEVVVKEEKDVYGYMNDEDVDESLMDEDELLVKVEDGSIDCVVKEEVEIDEKLKEESDVISAEVCNGKEKKEWYLEGCTIKQEVEEGL